ncbi:MAG: spore coat U domain-containing protein [Rhizomicrobium sp.]
MIRRLCPAAALLVLLAAPLPVFAQSAGAVYCALSVTPLAFGNYVPSSGAPADFSASITVTCTASAAVPVDVRGTIALLSGGASGRVLTTGSQTLRYQLFSDPARSLPWGDGSGDGATVAVSGVVGMNAEFRQIYTVYGRILARQSSAATGNYASLITVELNY